LTATTIDTPWGERVTGVIRCWMGRRWIEIEDSDGQRHIGRLPRGERTFLAVDPATVPGAAELRLDAIARSPDGAA
jgi:hypothetical protein